MGKPFDTAESIAVEIARAWFDGKESDRYHDLVCLIANVMRRRDPRDAVVEAARNVARVYMLQLPRNESLADAVSRLCDAVRALDGKDRT